MAKSKRKAKKRKGIGNILVKLSAIALVVYASSSFITQQVALSEKQQEVDRIKSEIEVAQGENDELEHILSLTDEDEYMERMAIERLGYAYPQERRFYTTSGN